MMDLTSEQSGAVYCVIDRIGHNQRVVSLSGPAGSGKTTLLDTLVNERPGAVCTPTNKAAFVLNNKGIPASTFFRRFFILEKVRHGKPRFLSCRQFLEMQHGDQWRDYEHMLPSGKQAFEEVIYIDEASMLTTWAIGHLLQMCDTLVLVGDGNQLPPIGDRDAPRGYFCGRDHDAVLTKVLRQGEGSPILDLATKIREGRRYSLDQFAPGDDELFDPNLRSICYTNKDRQRINMVARSLLERRSPFPESGDVMVVTNNYSDTLLNGTEVYVQGLEWDGRSREALLHTSAGSQPFDMHRFMVDQTARYNRLMWSDALEFDPDSRPEDLEEPLLEATYGYCLTVHKAQGSEWGAVVVFDQVDFVKRMGDRSHGEDPRQLPGLEAARRWLYTAVTRTRKRLIVAPTWWAKE